VLKFGNGVTKNNYDLVGCFDPAAEFLGLDALSMSAFPEIEINKELSTSETGPWLDNVEVLVGTDIYYRFIVTNNGNVPLENIAVTDPSLGDLLHSDPDYVFGAVSLLEEGGGTITFGAVGPLPVNPGIFSNTAYVEGIYYPDGDGLGYPVVDSDQASYFGADPSIDIVKITLDDYGNQGDGIGVIPGETLTWKYYVTNTGNIPLDNVTITDDQGVIPSFDAEISGNGDLIFESGEEWLYTSSGTAQAGWYENEGFASGDYGDDVGNSTTVSDIDESSCYGLDGGYLTDSSLCEFGDNFTLVFTPDVQNWPRHYKLSNSNPGQFYYNLFYIADGDDTITVKIPYPFVTQGDMPIHVYSGVFVSDDCYGVCFTPVGLEMTLFMEITLNPEGDDAELTIEGLPTEGFVYIGVRLDYGLKKTNGWVKGKNDDALYDDKRFNPACPDIPNIPEPGYIFDSDIPDSDDSISNSNIFENPKGFGGLVIECGQGIEGETVILYAGDRTTVLDTMTTDENGWYSSEYVHKGKAAEYYLELQTVYAVLPNPIQVSVGGKIKFGEGNFECCFE
jgi:uncharacterized repeat protein (TIGR01451 family)